MRLDVVDQWFHRERIDDTTTLLTEPAVHPMLRCNIWHIKGRDCDLVVDTGLGVASLAKAAADLFGSDLLAVATHSHMDHLGGFHEFEDRAIHVSEAESAASAAEGLPLDVHMYSEDDLDWFAAVGYDISGGLLTAVPTPDFDLTNHAMVGCVPTRTLVEGDIVDLGDRAFEVLHLPGHSPGSIGLWEAATGVLFSGDAVYDGPLLDQIPGSNADDYVATMERLLELPVTVVHAGHDPSMGPDRYRQVITTYLETRGSGRG